MTPPPRAVSLGRGWTDPAGARGKGRPRGLGQNSDTRGCSARSQGMDTLLPFEVVIVNTLWSKECTRRRRIYTEEKAKVVAAA